MTTRKDGTITISVELDGQYLVSPSEQAVAFPPSVSLASLLTSTKADIMSNLRLGQGQCTGGFARNWHAQGFCDDRAFQLG